MYVIKGLLIFAPFILCNISILRTFNLRIKILLVILFITELFIIISPISFNGWIIDYILYFLAMTLFMSYSFKDLKLRSIKIVLTILSLLLIFGYSTIGELFGPELYKKYTKNDVTYTIYKIPDMVAAPTFKIKVSKEWLIFERKLYKSDNTSIYCKKFDYDLDNNKLIITDTCKIITD